MNLIDIFNSHTDRESNKWNHYHNIYERYLQRFIGKEFTLLEIGTGNGGSLQIWKKYFGPKVKIIGLDIDVRTKFNEDQIKTYIGHQSDPIILEKILKENGNPDVIIDDGSHDQLEVYLTLRNLFPKLNDNGVYVIEDTHTAYWEPWKGGINSVFNIVAYTSRFAHDVNLQHIKEPYTPQFENLKSISYYDSMIILEKEIPKIVERVTKGNNTVQW
jgi:hypothetical protein